MKKKSLVGWTLGFPEYRWLRGNMCKGGSLSIKNVVVKNKSETDTIIYFGKIRPKAIKVRITIEEI